MENEQIISAEQIMDEENRNPDGYEHRNGVSKALLGIIAVLLMLITGGGAYYLGTKGSNEDGDVTPTETLLQTETLGEETQDMGDAVDITPTVMETETITPTTNPSVTPTVTPKVTLVPFNPNLKVENEYKIITSTPTPTPI